MKSTEISTETPELLEIQPATNRRRRSTRLKTPRTIVYMAGFFRRLGGMLLDLIPIVVIWGILAWLGLLNRTVFISPDNLFFWDHMLVLATNQPEVFWPPLLLLIFVATFYTFLFHLLMGTTPGKWLLSIKILGSNSLPPEPLACLLRCIGHIACLGSLGLGWLWIVVNPERRGFHDLLSGTFVVLNKESESRGDFKSGKERS